MKNYKDSDYAANKYSPKPLKLPSLNSLPKIRICLKQIFNSGKLYLTAFIKSKITPTTIKLEKTYLSQSLKNYKIALSSP